MLSIKTLVSALTLMVLGLALVDRSSSAPTRSTDGLSGLQKRTQNDSPSALPQLLTSHGHGHHPVEEPERDHQVRARSFDPELLSGDQTIPGPPPQLSSPASSASSLLTPGSPAIGDQKILLKNQPSFKHSLQPKRFQDSSVAEDANQFLVSPPSDPTTPKRLHLLQSLETRTHPAGSDQATIKQPIDPKHTSDLNPTFLASNLNSVPSNS